MRPHECSICIAYIARQLLHAAFFMRTWASSLVIIYAVYVTLNHLSLFSQFSGIPIPVMVFSSWIVVLSLLAPLATSRLP